MANMEGKKKYKPNPKLKLMDQVRETLRYYHYAYATERSYCQWILRYIYFYEKKRHPKDMGPREIERFLSHLANKDKVAASTQRQALNALIFLYREVLQVPIEDEIAYDRSKRKVRPPVVLTVDEVHRLFGYLEGTHLLMAKLIYGAGLRLMECLRLRVHDLDFGQERIFIRGGKGGKDRTTFLPGFIRSELAAQIEKVKKLHALDTENGVGEVYLPEALSRKYRNAASSISWQYIFPARSTSKDPRTGRIGRHHVLESGLQKAVKAAASKAGIDKKVTVHTLRHSFATHLLENGMNIRMLQDLLGHADVKTTEIYTHVMKMSLNKVKNPLDLLYGPQ